MTDWVVPCSDDETFGDGGEFIPPPEVITDLFKKIDREELLNFDAKIYHRRELETQMPKECAPVPTIPVSKTPEKMVTEVKTEFDFSSQVEEEMRFTPRRTPNRPQVKKVAKIENVFSDIMKYQKLENEQHKNKTE